MKTKKAYHGGGKLFDDCNLIIVEHIMVNVNGGVDVCQLSLDGTNLQVVRRPILEGISKNSREQSPETQGNTTSAKGK